jgi:hypothetical protein
MHEVLARAWPSWYCQTILNQPITPSNAIAFRRKAPYRFKANPTQPTVDRLVSTIGLRAALPFKCVACSPNTIE